MFEGIKKIVLSVISAGFLLVHAGYGDIVTLKNGQVIEGVSKDQGEQLEIRTRTTRFIVPHSSVASILKKEYNLEDDQDDKLTQEQIRRKKAENLFRKARDEIDRMNLSQAVAILEKAVEEDPGYDKGLETLIILLVQQQDYKKAKQYLEQLKNVIPLTSKFEELGRRIDDQYNKILIKEKRHGKAVSLQQRSSLPDSIPDAAPAADFSGAYYIEYSYYVKIQQSGQIASVAVYSGDPKTPILQCSAVVKGNYILLDLSRVNPSLPQQSVYAIMSSVDNSYTLIYRGTPFYYFGKKINTPEELEGFKELLMRRPAQALANFEKALEKDPDNSHVHFGQARAQMFSNKYRKSLLVLEKVKQKEDFSKYLFMDKLLNISTEYATAKIMSEKGENAIDDYEEAIRQFPLREANFDSFQKVIESGESLNSFTAEEAKRLLDPFSRSLEVLENTYKKPFCHLAVPGTIDAVPFYNAEKYLLIAKLLLVKTKLASYENRFEDALLGANQVFQMGHHMIQGYLPTRMIGIQIEQWGIEAFREVISSLKTTDQATQLKETLDQFLENPAPHDYVSLVSYERVEWPNVSKTIYSEAALRARLNIARLAMLRLAVAAKTYYLVHHQWPVSPSMLVQKYIKEYPQDPFGKENLKIFFHPGGFRIYSLGPDRTDNRGNLPYDASNGINSKGDILMDIK